MPRKNQYIGGIIGADPLVPYDEHWDDVKLLLDGSSLTDDLSDAENDLSSYNNTAVTGGGAVTLGTTDGTTVAHPYGSTAVAYLDFPEEDGLAIPTTFDLSGGDWTFECWVYFNKISQFQSIFSSAVNNVGIQFALGNDQNQNKFRFDLSGQTPLETTTSLSQDTWYHAALTYVDSSQTLTIYVDGSNAGSSSRSLWSTITDQYLGGPNQDTSVSNNGHILVLGVNRSNGYPLDGKLTDVRFTKGVARYTANFTPPDASFPTAADPIRPSGVSNLGALGGDGAVIGVYTFATLDPDVGRGTLSQGNLQLNPTAAEFQWRKASQGLHTSGKYYAEIHFEGNTAGSTVAAPGFGVHVGNAAADSFLNGTSPSWSPVTTGSYLVNNSSRIVTDGDESTSPGVIANHTGNQTFMLAWDVGAGKFWWGVDGVWYNGTSSINKTDVEGGTNAQFTGISTPSSSTPGYFVCHSYSATGAPDVIWNFGQDHTFAGTKSPLTTPYTDDDGNGEFYYETPSGFVGLYTTTLAASTKPTRRWGGITGGRSLVDTNALPTTGVLTLAEHYQTKL